MIGMTQLGEGGGAT